MRQTDARAADIQMARATGRITAIRGPRLVGGVTRFSAAIHSSRSTETKSSVVSDVATTSVTLAAGTVAVSSIKWLENSGWMNKLLSRKLIHSIAGPGYLLFWPFFGDSFDSQLIASLTPFLNGVSLFLAGSTLLPDKSSVSAISRSGDAQELLKGPLYYCIVLTLVTLLFWRHSVTAVAIVSVMCAGDGAADIVGRAFGKDEGRKLPWSENKSYPGSIAMFLGGFAMSVIMTMYFGHFDLVTYNEVTIEKLAVIAFAATILESIESLSIDDNISVPLLVGFTGYLMGL
jgi:phytol kinase